MQQGGGAAQRGGPGWSPAARGEPCAAGVLHPGCHERPHPPPPSCRLCVRHRDVERDSMDCALLRTLVCNHTHWWASAFPSPPPAAMAGGSLLRQACLGRSPRAASGLAQLGQVARPALAQTRPVTCCAPRPVVHRAHAPTHCAGQATEMPSAPARMPPTHPPTCRVGAACAAQRMQ
jgi:hypothetical protein